MSSPTKLVQKGQMDLDDILVQLGQFGRYHIYIYFLISVPLFFSSMFALNYIFTTMTVDHRCHIPECDQDFKTYKPTWLRNAVPYETFQGKERPERCLRYKSKASKNTSLETDVCPAEWFEKSTTSCDQWNFVETDVTIATEWNITCDEAWKLSLVGTMNNVGQFIGYPIIGHIGDAIGRKKTFLIGIIGSCIMGISKSFMPNYYAFLTFEILDPLFACGIYSSGFILGMELVGPKKRVFGGVVIGAFYAFGEIILGFVALGLRNWRHLLRVVYCPALLFMSYYWLLPESVRWLISKGRLDDARTILRRAAKINRVTLDENLLYSIRPEEEPLTTNNDIKEEKPSIPQETVLQVFKSKVLLLRLFNCWFCWLTNNFVYFGLSLNSVSVGGDGYWNFIFVALIELPAFVATYFLMTYWGRKWTMFSSLTLTGTACICFIFVPAELPELRLALFMTGKFAITVSFTTIFVFTAEMFPTQLRSSMIATCAMFGRIGSIIAPQTPLLVLYFEYEPIPLILFGSFSMISAMLSLLFPETIGARLPDTIEEAEKIGKKPRVGVL